MGVKLENVPISIRSWMWRQNSTCWIVFMGSYNWQTHYKWQQNSWNCQPSTLQHIDCINLLGTDHDVNTSDGDNSLVGPNCSQPIIYRERQSCGWKDRVTTNPIQIHTFYWTLYKECRRAQTHQMDTVHIWHEWKGPTCDEYRCAKHVHPADVWISTCSRRKLKEQYLDASYMPQ